MCEKENLRLCLWVSFLMLIIVPKSYAQGLNQVIERLSNNDVQYEVLKVGVTTLQNGKLDIPQLLVKVTSVDTQSLIRKYGKKSLVKKLFSLLNDPKKDWYVNLLLYEITERDATNIISLTNRAEWESVKQFDIDYWKIYVAKHFNK